MALRFLAQRPRSEQEVRRRLRRAGVAEAAEEAVISQLRQNALVDDTAFAEYWVEQRQSFRPRGARLLRAELRQHGIDTRAAEAAAETTAASAADAAQPPLTNAPLRRAWASSSVGVASIGTRSRPSWIASGTNKRSLSPQGSLRGAALTLTVSPRRVSSGGLTHCQ